MQQTINCLLHDEHVFHFSIVSQAVVKTTDQLTCARVMGQGVVEATNHFPPKVCVFQGSRALTTSLSEVKTDKLVFLWLENIL